MTMNYGRWKNIQERCQGISGGQSRMIAAILNLQRDRGFRKGARMERLTQKAPDSEMVWFKEKERLFEPCEMSAHQSRMAIAKLAAYEQDEEQGLLLRLPCKVGDTLYCITPYVKEPIITTHVLQMNIKELYNKRIIVRIDVMDKMGESCYFLDDIGKKVFLSRAEAEAKLAEMEGSE